MLGPEKVVYFKDDPEVEDLQKGEWINPKRIAAYSVSVMQDPPPRFDDEYTWVQIKEEGEQQTIARTKDIIRVAHIDDASRSNIK